MNLNKEKISIKDIHNQNCFNKNKELKNMEILFKKIENAN